MYFYSMEKVTINFWALWAPMGMITVLINTIHYDPDHLPAAALQCETDNTAEA